jgi:hypothetical protein
LGFKVKMMKEVDGLVKRLSILGLVSILYACSPDTVPVNNVESIEDITPITEVIDQEKPTWADMQVEGTFFSLNGYRDRQVSVDSLTGTWLGIGIATSDSSYDTATHEVRTVFQVRPEGDYVRVANCGFRDEGMLNFDTSQVQNGINVYWTPVSNRKIVAGNDIPGTFASDYDNFSFEGVKISDDYNLSLVSETLEWEKADLNQTYNYGNCVSEFLSTYISKEDDSELFTYRIVATGVNHLRDFNVQWLDSHLGTIDRGGVEVFIDLETSITHLLDFDWATYTIGDFDMSFNNAFGSNEQVITLSSDERGFHKAFDTVFSFRIPD